MKFAIPFLFLAAFLTGLSSCKDEGFFSEQAPADALNGLNNTGKEPEFSLDWINKKQITASENTVEGNDIEVVGWAMDPDTKQPASKVYLSVNGTLFSTECGVERADVANYFKNPAYQKSGFRAKFSRSAFTPGVYSLEVKVLSSDKSSYFSSTPERTVVIKL